jgi:hypothetical protein
MPLALIATVLLLVASPALAVSPGRLADLRVPAEPAVIPIDAILSGGPPPQGIPALGFRGLTGVAPASPDPSFETQDEAGAWIDDAEPVLLVRVGDEARIYPLQILTWHEIVNDTLAGAPVAVTFCPLCNSGLAFDRRVPLDDAAVDALRAAEGDLSRLAPLPGDLADAWRARQGTPPPAWALDVTFGVSGLLYFSNLLMFDEATRTLWSQLTGEAAVGPLAGRSLVRYAAQMLSFEDARAATPDALVLGRDTGFPRSYGRNPYVGYDRVDTPAFLFEGPEDGRLPPKARVVTIDGPVPVAYPFERLEAERVVHDLIAGEPVVTFWTPGAASALDAASIAQGRDVGATGVFDPVVDGRELRFEADGDAFVDDATGSRWDVTGLAVAGPLAGTRLTPIPHDATLWFAWAAFRPDTEIRDR